MRTEGRTRRLIRDLIAAVAAFGIVFAVAYVAGRASMPTFRAAIGEIPIQEEQATGSGEVSITSLRADLAVLELPAAVVASSGAVEGTATLDRGESLSGGFFSGEFDDSAIDIHSRFTGSDGSLTIRAVQMALGVARTEGMTIVLTIDGQTFNPRGGMCTLELSDFGYDSVRRPWGTVLLPWYDGQLVCSDVPELRSGELVSFTAVFAHRDH